MFCEIPHLWLALPGRDTLDDQAGGMAHSHIHTHHTHSHIRTQTHTHTHTHARTHTRTQTHTHTYTHIEKHTQSGQREDASQSSRLGTDYFYIQITVQEINLDTKHVLLYMSSVIQ